MFRTFIMILLAASSALAQSTAVAPPQTSYGTPISLDNARKASAAAVAEARKNNLSMAVAVVDTAGYLVFFERMDNTQYGSVQIAIEKAKTAALFRRPSKVFQDGLAAGGDGLRFLGLTGAMPVEGGFPIMIDGKIVGAVGASGGAGPQDSQVGRAGADSIK